MENQTGLSKIHYASKQQKWNSPKLCVCIFCMSLPMYSYLKNETCIWQSCTFSHKMYGHTSMHAHMHAHAPAPAHTYLTYNLLQAELSSS